MIQEESVGIEEDTTETTPEEKSSTTKVTNVSDHLTNCLILKIQYR